MKNENEITVRTKSCGGRRIEKMPLVEMKDTLGNGGRVTLLIRHAERPPLELGDKTFGASLSLTENGWVGRFRLALLLEESHRLVVTPWLKLVLQTATGVPRDWSAWRRPCCIPRWMVAERQVGAVTTGCMAREQQSALNAMMAGRNVLLTGEAATVLREFSRQCNRACAVLAPTGVAASNVGGSTIHSFFMFKPGLMTEDAIDEIGSGKKRAVIRAVKTIIIDEMSMVRSDVFAAIDISLRSLARGGNREKLYGGKQMILVGDFFQLPPVVKV